MKNMYILPERVNQVLNPYFNLINSQLPSIFEGFYLSGSISLRAYDKKYSDIDFVAVTNRELTKQDITILKKVHSIIKKRFRDTDLDGIYIQKNHLDSSDQLSNSCLGFLDGKQKSKSFAINSIDAYQLKRYGITLIGQEPVIINYEVNWDILLKGMLLNLNTYWQNWRNSCDRILSSRFIGSYFSLQQIEWGVTGVSRLYYTFRERDITSKIGAAEYALKTVPKRWHMIINESMRLRKGNPKSYYKSIIQRRSDALGYIDYIIRESNHLFKIN